MRARVPRTACLVVVLAGVAAGGADAHAAEPELESLVAGSSTCPRPDLMLAELATLLPPERLSARLRAVTTVPAVELVDLGAPYQVVVAGHVREYRDEARDCTQRARVAAVFVAMTIDPASIAAPPPAPVRPPPPPPVTELMPQAERPPRARAEVAASVDAGVGSSDRTTQGGAAVRVAVGGGRLAFVAGANVLLPVDITVGGVRLRQLRIPFDAGVRARFAERRGLSPYAELGLCAAVLSESADLATSTRQNAVEIGARAALGLRVGGPYLAPFAALHVEVIPSPAEIYALPQGVAGHTPYLWIGGSAGASIGFLP